jgi:hypothetical protein
MAPLTGYPLPATGPYTIPPRTTQLPGRYARGPGKPRPHIVSPRASLKCRQLPHTTCPPHQERDGNTPHSVAPKRPHTSVTNALTPPHQKCDGNTPTLCRPRKASHKCHQRPHTRDTPVSATGPHPRHFPTSQEPLANVRGRTQGIPKVPFCRAGSGVRRGRPLAPTTDAQIAASQTADEIRRRNLDRG